MLYTPSDLFDLSQTEHAALFEGVEFPWDVLKRLKAYLAKNLRPAQYHRTEGSAYVGVDVFIGEGTVVEHGAMIVGPAIIGRNCRIRRASGVSRPASRGGGGHCPRLARARGAVPALSRLRSFTSIHRRSTTSCAGDRLHPQQAVPRIVAAQPADPRPHGSQVVDHRRPPRSPRLPSRNRAAPSR